VIRVECETCGAGSWSGGTTAARMAAWFEADHAGRGHTTRRVAVRQKRKAQQEVR